MLARSSFFDWAFYEVESGERFASAEQAAAHYLAVGAERGLNPSELFDTRFYWRRYGEVRAADTNPLEHFLRAGLSEGRSGTLGGRPLAPRPKAPDPAVWERLARCGFSARRELAAALDADAAVDVIVPVYRGYADTLACLHSVLVSRNRTPFRLVVIDDASPDPQLRQALSELARLDLITLRRNPGNLGFVRTANLGMALSNNRDALLLNADTVVYGDWLDRLRAHAGAQPRVASVTPMSNNATIFSYPHFNWPNPQALEIDYPSLDAAFAEVNRGESIEVPTGVGFCFYLPRAALGELGGFDERVFGRGYGEENDYCRRAAERGWRNLAALDTFVRHTGEVSFSQGAAQAQAAAQDKLARVHPSYPRVVARFVARDPFAQARARIDLWRARRAGRGRGVLMVLHRWGGGTQRHVASLCTLLRTDGFSCLLGTPSDDGRALALQGGGDLDLPNLPQLSFDDPESAADLLASLDLERVHIHALLGLNTDRYALLVDCMRRAGVPWDVTVHDYAAICPRINMVDWSGGYCDSPSVNYCQTCIDKAGSLFGDVDVARWRADYRTVLEGARTITVPHEDVADRLHRYLPELQVVVERHPHEPEPAPRPAARRPTPRPSGEERPLRIGVIGAIGQHKGSSLLVALAADARLRKLPIRFMIFGYSNDDDRLSKLPNVSLTGPYLDADLDRMLAAAPCDFAFFPSVWPETFCFTLDHAVRNGLYPVAFDLGAPAARIAEMGFGEVLPRTLMFDPQALNDRLLQVVPTEPRTWPVLEAGRSPWTAERYYGAGAARHAGAS